MVMTPARAHVLRMTAASLSADDSGAQGLDPAQTSAYELMQAQLYEHRRALKAIQSIERKIEAKRAYLPLYWPWIDGVLASGRGAADVVLTTVLVWAIDAGEYPRALDIAGYVLEHGLALPDQYQRDPATTLIDEMAEAGLKGKLPADEAVPLLLRVESLTQSRDVPDQARAKLHKAIGYALIGRTAASEVDYKDLPADLAAQALPHLHRAFELFDGVGVKKDIERLERRVKDAAAQEP